MNSLDSVLMVKSTIVLRCCESFSIVSVLPSPNFSCLSGVFLS
jgi:hypothetical protein